MQKKIIKYIFLYLVGFLGISLTSCKKIVETEVPDTEVNGDNVYTNDATAIAVLTGIYSNLAQGTPYAGFSSGTKSLSLVCGLSADEYTLFSGADLDMMAFYQNALTSNTVGSANYWNLFYNNIFNVNTAIEGLTNSKGLTDVVKQQLLGEAKFIRAFYYFYLINLYGNVPLVTTTDYPKNTAISRAPKEDVYQQIIKDLQDAESLLSADYLNGYLQKYTSSSERIRPTKGAAAALLARVYLYNGNLTGDVINYANGEAEATNVISNTSLYDTTNLNNVFLKNSKEAIWQLQVVKSNQNTDDSKMFIITSGLSSTTPVSLSDTLLNSFEPGDNRKLSGNWVNKVTLSGNIYNYPYKYKNNTGTVTEYMMVLRLAEQYLIRAEVRAQQNKNSEARSDLNVIRKRAGLPNTTAADKTSLLTAILHERQTEFFSEWGNRWFDLKRTNTADALMSVMTPKKGGAWETTDKLYPLPFTEVQRAPNLIQNDGY
jgi:hypothetical protein